MVDRIYIMIKKVFLPVLREGQSTMSFSHEVVGPVISSVAVALTPLASVALILWLPGVMSAGMVAVAVNAPLASVVMVASESRVSLSIINVAFLLPLKPEPAIVTWPPALIDEGVSTSVAVIFPVTAVAFPAAEVWLPVGAADVALPGGRGIVAAASAVTLSVALADAPLLSVAVIW
jgi:hypothetical protein